MCLYSISYTEKLNKFYSKNLVFQKKKRKKYIKDLENEMLEAAKNLEFERAAVLRDEIQNVKNMQFDWKHGLKLLDNVIK